MSSYELGLLAHLLGAFLFFGGALLAAVVFEAARRRSRPGEVALLLGLARIAVVLVLAGALLVLGAGLWLAQDVDQLGEPWVVASLALYVAAVVLGALGGRRPKQARRLAEQLASEDAGASPELRRLLDDPASRAANYASGALILAILVLMVWQPGR
jgi:uncharacterized membrane protein